ncbi:hypothetical protein P7K49_014201 [Saguinus oedipus]|uniref:Uncharacterized protein n=1 Tax=Saguinus oedipus TaxID=9490 RepID=A0ABQ9VI63_SAGOE|nr:hypothetical protein P7K49_014201 [Saguinus oedipus]
MDACRRRFRLDRFLPEPGGYSWLQEALPLFPQPSKEATETNPRAATEKPLAASEAKLGARLDFSASILLENSQWISLTSGSEPRHANAPYCACSLAPPAGRGRGSARGLSLAWPGRRHGRPSWLPGERRPARSRRRQQQQQARRKMAGRLPACVVDCGTG